MTREQACAIIIATAEVDEDGEDLEACAPGEHPVDADVIAQMEEDEFYATIQDEYLASLSDHDRTMLRINREPVEHFRFTLKANGKLKKKPARAITDAELESIPF